MRSETRTRDAIIGLVYLIVIAALIALSIAIFDKQFASYTAVSAKTSTIGSSLQAGSDVKIRGINVGTVGDVSTDGDEATIDLRIDPDRAKSIPGNVTVQLLPKTLFGERYVNLAIPADPEGELREDQVLAQDKSPHAVELEQLFSDLVPVLQAVQPEKLSATLGEVAGALRNRGGQLGETLTVVGKYFDGLAPQVPAISDDFARLADVADTYAEAAPDILAGLNALTTTGNTLVKQRSQYGSLLRSLTQTGNTYGEFVGTNSDDIIGLSQDSRSSLRIAAKYASEFPCLSRALVNYIPTVDKAFGAGTQNPGAKVVLRVVDRVGAYRSSDRPVPYTADPGPRCPYTPPSSLAGTALSDVPGVTGADTTVSRINARVPGLGSVNSPQENQLIAELMAPTSGTAPSDYPKWASLLVGPALRGKQVTVK